MADMATMPPVTVFQSTHPRGVRLRVLASVRPCHARFNPRTRVGCDAVWQKMVDEMLCFNPRTRVGCDNHAEQTFLVVARVSIHAPAWGATRRACLQSMQGGSVSIHAPAWGATLWKRPRNGAMNPFQSTHPRGVRLLPWRKPRRPKMFQSTHPRGVRRESVPYALPAHVFQSTHPRGVRPAVVQAHARCGALVSIHAPAWGATVVLRAGVMEGASFNPRTRVGCDPSSMKIFYKSKKFQSTHPRGVRHGEALARSPPDQFQSTHPRGVRRRACMRSGALNSFQSTHPRGVRRVLPHSAGCGRVVSIHAPAWGATSAATTPVWAPTACFNPRTRVGCDRTRRPSPRT